MSRSRANDKVAVEGNVTGICQEYIAVLQVVGYFWRDGRIIRQCWDDPSGNHHVGSYQIYIIPPCFLP